MLISGIIKCFDNLGIVIWKLFGSYNLRFVIYQDPAWFWLVQARLLFIANAQMQDIIIKDELNKSLFTILASYA